MFRGEVFTGLNRLYLKSTLYCHTQWISPFEKNMDLNQNSREVS